MMVMGVTLLFEGEINLAMSVADSGLEQNG